MALPRGGGGGGGGVVVDDATNKVVSLKDFCDVVKVVIIHKII
jgi:hypothetical protein